MDAFLSTFGFLIVSMLFAAMMALSLYLPLMAGQLSLASPAFYAIGGYVGAVMSTQARADGLFPMTNLVGEMTVAGLICAVTGLIVGGLALRLRGIYLAIATIALIEIVRVVSLNLTITGGAVGIFDIPQPFTTKFDYIWIALPMLLICIVFFYRLENIGVGRAFRAIREDELAAGAMGINTTYYKVLAFVMGAVLAGAVGAVSAHFLGTWNARQGTFDTAILYLAFVIIGGSRTFVGPIMGGLLLTALPEILRAVAGIDGIPVSIANLLKDGRFIIYGSLIVIGSIFFPQGLITPDLLSLFSRKDKQQRENKNREATV